MIDLYTWPTPNGHKVHIMLEETGLPYRVIPINIGEGDQFDPEFLKISPNNKMPAIVDQESADGKPYSLFESGAILIYLAEKTGKFMPKDVRGCYDVIQWLMFQMGGFGPMLGQVHHFRRYAPETIPYAIDRYTNEGKRLYGVVNKRLEGRDYVCDKYSIADMAIFPWMRLHEGQEIDIGQFPNVKKWLARIEKRPAVKRGLAVLKESRQEGPMSDKAKELLFGKSQYQAR